MNIQINIFCKNAVEIPFYNILHAKQMLMLLWMFCDFCCCCCCACVVFFFFYYSNLPVLFTESGKSALHFTNGKINQRTKSFIWNSKEFCKFSPLHSFREMLWKNKLYKKSVHGLLTFSDHLSFSNFMFIN